ncbi:MAG: tripartite tricarboxylate transporter substrate binding protein [Burkholderiales bacterium]|nr:tripartite tricarboxylate transporter substrate binding protein [Burkholderiales bacterium]
MKKSCMLQRSAIGAATVLLFAFAAQGAHAQNYPTRTVRYIVPQAPGGSSDTLARVLAPRLATALGQQVVVDNRPGATGIIGAELTVKAPPDGHTLLQVATSHATNPAMGIKLPYDTLRDFTSIALISQQPNIWLAHPSLPARNIRQLIAFAKPRPGDIDFASSGTGSSQHLAGELLNVMTGIKLVHIPYKGSPPALTDTLAGRVALMSSTMAPAIPHMKSGRLHALGVTSAKRSPAAPEIPTVAESGVPGYEAIAWQGLVAPAGLPAEVVNRLSRELVRILGLADVRRILMEQGYEPVGGTAEEFMRFTQSEIAKWTKVTTAAGLRE